MRRRDLLALPAVFGLDALLGCGSSTEDDRAAALAYMKATGRFGVLLSAPRDPEARQAWGHLLYKDFEKPSPALRKLLEEAVVIAVDDGGPAITLLDANGARLGSAAELGRDFAVIARDLIAGRAKGSKDNLRALPFGVRVETGPVPVDVPCAYCGLDGPYRTLDVGKFFKLLGD